MPQPHDEDHLVARNLEFLSRADRRLFEAMFRLGEATRTTPSTPPLKSHSFPVTLSDKTPVTFQSVLTRTQIRFLQPLDEESVPVAVFFRRLVTLINQVRTAADECLDGLTEALTSLPRATKENGGREGQEPRGTEPGEGDGAEVPARRSATAAGEEVASVPCCCYTVGGVEYKDVIGPAECDDRGGVWRPDMAQCLDAATAAARAPRKGKRRGRRS